MKTFKDLLQKLNKLNFIKVDGSRLLCENLIGVSYEIKSNSLSPMQVVINISYKDSFVTIWGCENIEDGIEFINNFNTWKRMSYHYDSVLNQENREKGLDILENL